MEMLEHATLLRHLAGLQNRVSQQVYELVDARTSACQQLSEANRRCADLERQLVHERARQIAGRTAWLWGLLDAWMAATTPRAVCEAVVAATSERQGASLSPSSLCDSTTTTTAFDLLCQTGCQGHAHAWQSDDGLCQITGSDCTRLLTGGGAPQVAPHAEPGGARQPAPKVLARQG
jgi:hypothetical protein